MNTIALHLYKAQDGLDAYAITRGGPNSSGLPGSWLAQKGFGSDFEKVWSVELQSHGQPPADRIDWDAVLERAIEACHMSDPVVSEYEWPTRTQSDKKAHTVTHSSGSDKTTHSDLAGVVLNR